MSLPIERLLHELWGKAGDHPDYDKKKWKQLNNLIYSAITGCQCLAPNSGPSPSHNPLCYLYLPEAR